VFLKFNLNVFSPFYLRSTSVFGALTHIFLNLHSVRCTDGRAIRAVPCFSYHSHIFVFMGKQLGIIQFSGKLDNVVGAKKSANQKSNVLRVHRATIANPKSAAQILRRMRLLPATNFYRALQPILNHAYQGTAYKAPSYSEFMKLALTNDVFPYVSRGESRPIPGPYQISKGSLPSISIRDFGEVGNGPMVSSLKVSEIPSEDTLGAFSSRLIAANPALKNGDQLTFIAVYSDDPDLYDANIVYLYAAIVLDITSTQTIANVMATKGVTLSAEDNFLGIEFNNMQADNALAAGAIILSRPSSTPGAAWQRSTTFMQIQPDTLNFIRSQAHFDAAFESYSDSKSTNVSSDWYLNQTKSRYQNGSIFLFAASNGDTPNALFINENGVQSIVLNTTSNKLYLFDGVNAIQSNIDFDDTVANTVDISYVKNIFPSLPVQQLVVNEPVAWRDRSPLKWLVDKTNGKAIRLTVESQGDFHVMMDPSGEVSVERSDTPPSDWGYESASNVVWSSSGATFTYKGVDYSIANGAITPEVISVYE